MTGFPLGAYGLRFLGPEVEALRDALVPVAANAPSINVEVQLASGVRNEEAVDAHSMLLSQRAGVRLHLQREARRAVLALPDPVGPAALVHPLLTMVANVFSRWLGRAAVHGGAFVHDGHAYGLLADRNGGKSTALAGLSRRSVPVLTDDLIVVQDGDVLAGARSVDLRPESGRVLQMGEALGTVGGRPRQRVALAQSPTAAPLGGFISLAWSPDEHIRVERQDLSQRLERLVAQEMLYGLDTPETSFQLLEVPMWRVSRPRDWDSFEASLDVMLDLPDD